MDSPKHLPEVIRHRGAVFSAVVRHLSTCAACRLDAVRFRFDRACEIGSMLRDEYLLARSYARTSS